MNCYHHPNREAVAIINLGTPIDLDTEVCEKCLAEVGEDKLVRRLTVRASDELEKDIYLAARVKDV